MLISLAMVNVGAVVGQSTNIVTRSDTATSVIPFTMAGKLMIIQATADTTEGNFIFDTGAGGLVLNNTYFRDYPVHQVPQSSQRTVTGEGEEIELTTVGRFKMGAMNYIRAEAELVSLARLEQLKGIKLLGLVGVGLFAECEVMVDYAQNRILLHHIGKKELKTYRSDSLADPLKYTSFPLEIKNNQLRITTRLANHELHFAIDYAAESSLIDSRLSDRLSDSLSIEGRVLLAGVGNKRLEVLQGSLRGMQLGGIAVPELPVIITRLENTCFGTADCLDGVLGYDFLSGYKIVINFRKRILYILK